MPGDWRCIREFKRRAAELAENSLIRSGQRIAATLTWRAGEGLVARADSLPPEEPFRALLLTFRLFWAKDESSNFLRVLNIMGRHTDHPLVCQFVDSLRSRWKQALFGGAMLMSTDGRPITADLIFDLWLNSHYFHTDATKQKDLESLAGMLSDDFLKFMLADAVTRCCEAVLALYNAIRELKVPEAAT